MWHDELKAAKEKGSKAPGRWVWCAGHGDSFEENKGMKVHGWKIQINLEMKGGPQTKHWRASAPLVSCSPMLVKGRGSRLEIPSILGNVRSWAVFNWVSFCRKEKNMGQRGRHSWGWTACAYRGVRHEAMCSFGVGPMCFRAERCRWVLSEAKDWRQWGASSWRQGNASRY